MPWPWNDAERGIRWDGKLHVTQYFTEIPAFDRMPQFLILIIKISCKAQLLRTQHDVGAKQMLVVAHKPGETQIVFSVPGAIDAQRFFRLIGNVLKQLKCPETQVKDSEETISDQKTKEACLRTLLLKCFCFLLAYARCG